MVLEPKKNILENIPKLKKVEKCFNQPFRNPNGANLKCYKFTSIKSLIKNDHKQLTKRPISSATVF